MPDLEKELCEVIEIALNTVEPGVLETGSVTIKSELNNPREWDSLSFVSVFLAVTQHFDLEVDDEDAINFRSVKEILAFMREI